MIKKRLDNCRVFSQLYIYKEQFIIISSHYRENDNYSQISEIFRSNLFSDIVDKISAHYSLLFFKDFRSDYFYLVENIIVKMI